MSSQNQERRFIYVETSTSPLRRVENNDLIKNVIDPTTNLPYEGIILEGEFASIGILNNNNRIYEKQNYLDLVAIIKKEIHSRRGVYGELEHPAGFTVNWNNVSHKILDIWYDETTEKVMGIIMLLNTEKGKIAQEVVKSGGMFAMSGRGGGKEIKNPDGTITALLKLMVTYDIVYHPGFTSAVLDINNDLSQIKNVDKLYEGVILYSEDLAEMNKLYESFIHTETQNTNFINWACENQLFESQKEQNDSEQKAQKILTANQAPNQQKIENNMENAVDQELTESEKFLNSFTDEELKKNDIFNSSKQHLSESLKRGKRNAGGALFDNSAGFIKRQTTQLSTDNISGIE